MCAGAVSRRSRACVRRTCKYSKLLFQQDMPAANVGRQDAFGPYGRRCQNVKLSNESPEKGLPCAKIRIGDREGPSRTIRVFQYISLFLCFLSFCHHLLHSFPPRRSFYTDGRNFTHRESYSLCAKKCRQVPVFVRTNDYDGADTSVRWCGRVRTNQSQVLSTVKWVR